MFRITELGFQQTPPCIDSAPDESGAHVHLNLMPRVTNINAVSIKNKAGRSKLKRKETESLQADAIAAADPGQLVGR